MPPGAKLFFQALKEKWIYALKNQVQYLLHYMNIVDRDDVDVLDAFSFEVIISLDITRNLGTASPRERSRNTNLRVMSKLRSGSIYLINGIQ